MSEYAWTDDMREISGFGGDEDDPEGQSYEDACREMVIAGAEWFDDHEDAEPVLRAFKNVTGIAIPENAEAEALEEAMLEPLDESPTGAMFHTCVDHVLFIGKNGWEAYVEKMEEEND